MSDDVTAACDKRPLSAGGSQSEGFRLPDPPALNMMSALLPSPGWRTFPEQDVGILERNRLALTAFTRPPARRGQHGIMGKEPADGESTVSLAG